MPKIHRRTVVWTPCGKYTEDVTSTRNPSEVTCKSCKKIQSRTGSIMRIEP